MVRTLKWTLLATMLVAFAACGKKDEKPIVPGPPIATVTPPATVPETIPRATATRVADSGLTAEDLAEMRADYPLTTCAVDGMALGQNPVEVIVQGRLVRLCSDAEIAEVERDPAAVFGRIDAAKQAALGS